METFIRKSQLCNMTEFSGAEDKCLTEILFYLK